METLLLIAGVLMMCGALAFAFSTDSMSSGCAFAYLGLTALNGSRYVSIAPDALIFWAIAVLIILLVRRLGQQDSVGGRVLRRYVAVGTLAGMMAGVALGSNASMICGAAAGALLGAMAYSRTASGAVIGKRIWKATLDTGLPSVVLMSMIGLVLLAIAR